MSAPNKRDEKINFLRHNVPQIFLLTLQFTVYEEAIDHCRLLQVITDFPTFHRLIFTGKETE
jgi:hypothetical protein